MLKVFTPMMRSDNNQNLTLRDRIVNNLGQIGDVQQNHGLPCSAF
jgi:hypothetical protein